MNQDQAYDLDDIAARGFPPYSRPERLCSPSNSSPYRLTRDDFKTLFRGDPWRLELLDNLDTTLDRLSSSGLVFPAVLIGGGYIRRLASNTVPNGIDGLVFYEIVAEDRQKAVLALRDIKPAAKALKMDLRFCPIDAGPLVMIESTAFFTILYSKCENGLRIENGLILYDRTLQA